LDAADSTTITGTTSITAWRDKSGSNNNAIFSGTNPSYVAASNVVITANQNQHFTIPAAAIATSTGTGSLLLVYGDQQTGSSYQAAWGTANPGSRFYQQLQGGSDTPYSVNGPFTNGTVAAALNNTNTLLYNMNYTYGSSTGDLRVNGTTITASYGGTPSPSGDLTISGTGWGVVANLRIYEVIIYKGTTVLTTAQLQQIEGYLAQKWGLTSRLPGGHPGLTQTLYTAPKARTLLTKQVYPSFSPVQLSNCALWLDGSDPLATGSAPSNGTAVNSWKDKSGNSANGTITSAGAAVYSASSNGLYLNGGGYFNLPNGTLTPGATNFSIFFICNISTFSNYPYFYFAGTTTANCTSFVFDPNGQVENGFWTDFMGQPSAGTAVVNTNMMFSLAYNNGSRTIYKNGTGVVTGTIAGTKNISSSNNFVGGASAIGGQPINGVINEFIVYNYFLPTSQRQQVEGYLAWKYGMQGTLSNGHPYYAATPSAAGVPANPTRFMTQVPYSGYSNVRYVQFTGGLNGDNWQDIAEISVYGPTGINLAFGKSVTTTPGYTSSSSGLGTYGVGTSTGQSSGYSGAALVDGDITTGIEAQNYIPVIDLGSNCLVSSASLWLGKFWGRSLNGQFDLLSSSSTLIKRWTITDTSSRQITWNWPN